MGITSIDQWKKCCTVVLAHQYILLQFFTTFTILSISTECNGYNNSSWYYINIVWLESLGNKEEWLKQNSSWTSIFRRDKGTYKERMFYVHGSDECKKCIDGIYRMEWTRPSTCGNGEGWREWNGFTERSNEQILNGIMANRYVVLKDENKKELKKRSRTGATGDNSGDRGRLWRWWTGWTREYHVWIRM